MAISKEILNNKKKTIQPEPLGIIPTNNPDHRSAPIDMHHPFPQKPFLYNSFEEAKDACGIIFLKPGEAHTEFYKSDKEYHCVVAIGNINPGYGHLYLTDSGSDMSIDDRLDNMNAGVNLYYKQVQILNTSVKNLNTSFIELNNLFNLFKIDVTGEIQSFITNVSAQIQDINDTVNANNSSTSNAINNFETYVNGKIAEISAEVQTYNNRIATLESWQQIADTSLKVLNEKIQYESSVNNQQDVSINLLKQSTDNLQLQIIELSLNNTLLIDKNNQYIKSTFNEVNRHIDTSVNEINQYIDSSINEVKEHIKSTFNEVNRHIDTSINEVEQHIDSSINEVEEHIEYVEQHIDSSFNEVEEHIDSSINEVEQHIDSSINEVNSHIDSSFNEVEQHIDLSINEVEQHIDASVNEIDQHINISIDAVEEHIDSSIEYVEQHIDSSFNEVEEHINLSINAVEEHIDSSIEYVEQHIDLSIEYVEQHIDSSFNEVERHIDSSFNEVEEHIDSSIEYVEQHIDLSINEVEEHINSSINEVNSHINTSVNEINQHINVSIDAVEKHINSSFNEVEEHINSSIDYVEQHIDSSINEVNSHIDISVNEINQHINVSIDAVEKHINSSILSLQNLINEFEPISNPSIDSLFHDDIYTVNLCCYTAAGGVEIYDDVSGGYDLRVANCTVPNEYKTYVKGDDVSFKAVENEGYKFVCWYYGDGRGHINEVSVDPIINLEFTNSDIPVIGTLADGANPAEPAILPFGYTAFFRKLHQVKWSFYQHTNVLNHPLAYFDDKLKITITDIDGNVSIYIIDKDYTRPIYFDDDSIVEIRAICSENGQHTFEGYTLDGSSEKLSDPLIIKNSAKDIVVCAEFKEWWILVQTDTEPRNMANIYSDGSDTYILHESRLHINVIDISAGWQFNKWTANGMDDATLLSYLDEGTLTDPNIVLHIDAFAEAGIYDLVAVLDTI